MSTHTKKLTDYAVYLAVRLVEMILHAIPTESIYCVGAFLGNVGYRLDARHRERASEHVRLCFPELPETEVQRIVRASFRNLMYVAFEVLLTTRLITRRRWRKHIVFLDMPEAFRAALDRHRGVVFVTGHFGGWEVVGYTIAALGFHGYAVARFLDNPYLNAHLLGIRQKMGMTIIDKRGAMYRMNAILRKGSYVGFTADQDAGPRGMFVDFFGRKASSYKAPGLVAMQFDVPVIVGYGRRMGEQYRFELGVQRIIRPSEWKDKPDPLRWITQEYTRAIEGIVRRDPGQYVWTHRRWKTRPPDEMINTHRPKQIIENEG